MIRWFRLTRLLDAAAAADMLARENSGLSVDASVRITLIDRESTQPGANGVVEFSPFEFLDRLADLVPPPRKHRHRYHGVFAPNHTLRRAVTALAIGNVGKLVQVHDDRAIFQASPDELPVIDIHSL